MKLHPFLLCVLCVLCGQSSLSAQRAITGIGSGGNSSVGIVRPPAPDQDYINALIASAGQPPPPSSD